MFTLLRAKSITQKVLSLIIHNSYSEQLIIEAQMTSKTMDAPKLVFLSVSAQLSLKTK